MHTVHAGSFVLPSSVYSLVPGKGVFKRFDAMLGAERFPERLPRYARHHKRKNVVIPAVPVVVLWVVGNLAVAALLGVAGTATVVSDYIRIDLTQIERIERMVEQRHLGICSDPTVPKPRIPQQGAGRGSAVFWMDTVESHGADEEWSPLMLYLNPEDEMAVTLLAVAREPFPGTFEVFGLVAVEVHTYFGVVGTCLHKCLVDLAKDDEAPTRKVEKDRSKRGFGCHCGLLCV